MPKEIVTEKTVTHTPGPWVAEFPDRGAMEMASIYAPALADGDQPWRVAYVLRETNLHQRLVDDANARLIAAAPELLAALKGILAHSDSWKIVETAGGDIARARAALAKVEGRS